MKPTIEQESILHLAAQTRDNLVINALAGTGKTSTLRMVERAINIRPILFLVFNKRNAEEARWLEADPDSPDRMLSTTVVQTLNACGHRVWAKTISRAITLNAKKTPSLLSDLIRELPKAHQREAYDVYWQVIQAVNLAKAYGYIPNGGAYPHARRLCSRSELNLHLDETPDALSWSLIDATLLASIRLAYSGTLDFNDQLYMPALFGGTFPRFPLTMVDELQDLSPVNHAMLDKLATGRLIGVGDPFQSIYAFRGAKQGGMADAQARFAMTPADLSVSFRCPRAIVEAARWRVPHFKWSKAGGHVETAAEYSGASFPDDATVICRNNAPLLRMAFKLISIGRSVNVVGSELGPRLVGVMKKLGDSTLPRTKAMSAIEEWREQKLIAGSKSAGDLADCMRVLCEHGDSLGAAISYAEHIFAQTGTIRLLTGHKSKGLEFDNVFILDPWLMSDSEQDMNLRYVCQTRSQNSLTYVDSTAILW